ncbi:FAD-binding oxidoreductase [Nocardiopsis rhodophaea]|uniref:FAD-binding oxidoreductase n=1 Tax=Nocardiopsis rhodophaea TaxID=280238 RepID=UPI0031CE2530
MTHHAGNATFTPTPPAARGAVTGIDTLAERVRGPVLRPGDIGYVEECSGFQTAFQQRPSVVVGATGADDVRAAVEYAVERDLPVGVQASGHGAPFTVEGGVLITTGRMDGVCVDAEARTARLEAGVPWRRVVAEAARHGLAPLNGSGPNVGAVSYTLGGGLGLLARRYGYAADHVRAIDVVTADARLRHVTAASDADLFWALRGGRDNFGVVTGLEVDLVPVNRIYGGSLVFDGDLVEDVLRAYLEWTRSLPEELTSSVATVVYPDIPQLPDHLRGRYVAQVRIAYMGDAAEGERLVAPLRALGPRLKDTLAEMPYATSGSIYEEPTTPHAYCGDNALLRRLDDSLVRPLVDLTGPAAPAMCVFEIRHLGGALSRPPSVPNAVGHREARYILRILSPLGDPGTVRPVHKRVLAQVEPWTMGTSLNFVFGCGEPPSPARVRAAYGAGDYARLTELKANYDPANTFRINHNIRPEGTPFPM